VETALAACLVQRLDDRLPGAGRGFVAVGHGVGQRGDQADTAGEQNQRALPAVGRDHHLPDGEHGKLAKRAAGTGDAEGETAPLRRRVAADDPHDHRESRSRQADADEQAGRQVEAQRRRRHRHENQAEHVEGGCDEQRPAGAETVGQGARKWRAETPDQVLQREGEGKSFARPAVVGRHRL
jgi:hypothetical protein